MLGLWVLSDMTLSLSKPLNEEKEESVKLLWPLASHETGYQTQHNDYITKTLLIWNLNWTFILFTTSSNATKLSVCEYQSEIDQNPIHSQKRIHWKDLYWLNNQLTGLFGAQELMDCRSYLKIKSVVNLSVENIVFGSSVMMSDDSEDSGTRVVWPTFFDFQKLFWPQLVLHVFLKHSWWSHFPEHFCSFWSHIPKFHCAAI